MPTLSASHLRNLRIKPFIRRLRRWTQSYFFLFTNCFTSSFPIGLAAEKLAAVIYERCSQ